MFHASRQTTELLAAGDKDLNVDSYIPIAELGCNKEYQQIFLVDYVFTPKKTSQGKPYVRATLKDVTGEIDGVIWGFEGQFEAGSYIAAKIKTKLYEQNMEFEVDI